MKKLPLRNRKKEIKFWILVDDEDFDWLNQWHWSSTSVKNGRKPYARRNPKSGHVYLHRLIKNCPKEKEVDHINGDTLDNRKRNLRICSKSENSMNHGKRSDNTSGFKGVCWDKATKKWRVEIMVRRKPIYMGVFSSKSKAAKIYNEAAKKLHGEFARLNKI